jgi:bifunctional non-homologous end joining protein LigD
VQLNEHLEAEGPLVFEHARRLGLEGIVSKRKASWYQSGRSRDWVKAKNPKAPAVTRLAEEDWTRAPQQIRSLLFDHLVGAAKKRQWESDAKRLSGLEIK